MNEDKARAAAKKASGSGFLAKPMSSRTDPNKMRKPCPLCNRGRSPIPKALRTTSRRAGADNGCGNCGGDGYLDPGDRGYGRNR